MIHALLTVAIAALVLLGSAMSHAQSHYVVGAWNLEHFKDNTDRGFPENRSGGPTYPPRDDDDYEFIAEVIRDELDAKILVLSEIHARDVAIDDEGNELPIPPDDGDIDTDIRSPELERLIGHLGSQYDYVIGSAGHTQRLAIL